MKVFLAIFALVLFANCDYISKVIKKYKDVSKSWETTSYEESIFRGWNEDEIKGLLGTTEFFEQKIDKYFKLDTVSDLKDLPTDFDARKQWPNCIHPIRDQGHCGSCWAFGVSEAISDRFCIASNQKINIVFAPQDLVSCDTVVNKGCNGGNPLLAYTYTSIKGIVTDQCFPYTSGTTKETGPCLIENKTCVSTSVPYLKYHTKALTIKTLTTVSQIQTDMYTNGPITAAMMVYEDFMSYKSGIYVRHSNQLLGGHAIKGVGWGHDQTTGYNFWIMANSWSPNWGENGFFRIRWGECEIDSMASSAQADV